MRSANRPKDARGNSSAVVKFAFPYDGTAPQILRVNEQGPDERGRLLQVLELNGIDPESIELKVAGKTYRVEWSEENGRYAACLGEHRIECELVTAEQRLRRRLENSLGGPKNAIQAHMPGTVLEVFVEPGAHVAKGDKIAVVEAMKMEDTIRAPQDATIETVQVSKGDSIQADQTIVTFKDQT